MNAITFSLTPRQTCKEQFITVYTLRTSGDSSEQMKFLKFSFCYCSLSSSI